MLQHTANRTNKWLRMLLIVCLYFRIKSNMIYPLAVSVSLKLCSWDLHLLCSDKQVKLLLLWHLLALRGVPFHEQTHSAHYTAPLFSIPVPLLLQSIDLKSGMAEVGRSLWKIRVHPSLPAQGRAEQTQRKLSKNQQKRNQEREETACSARISMAKTARMEVMDSSTEMCPFPLSCTGLHRNASGWQGTLQPSGVLLNSSSHCLC